MLQVVDHTPLDPITDNQDTLALLKLSGAYPIARLVSVLEEHGDLILSDKPVVVWKSADGEYIRIGQVNPETGYLFDGGFCRYQDSDTIKEIFTINGYEHCFKKQTDDQCCVIHDEHHAQTNNIQIIWPDGSSYQGGQNADQNRNGFGSYTTPD